MAAGAEKLKLRILFVSAADWAFRVHRLSLAKWLIQRGARVGVICPEGNERAILEAAGLDVYTMDWSRERVSLLETWRAAREIRRVATTFEADVVHCVSVRCVLLGWLANWGGRSWRLIHHVIGMGSLFSENPSGLKNTGLRALVEWGLKCAFRANSTVTVFQNQDDEALWRKRAGLGESQCVRLPGSIEWKEVAVPEPKTDMVRILFVGRMLEDKGVRELFAAWKQVCSRGAKVELILCGDVDSGNPRSLSRGDLENMADEKDCVWLGRIGNVLEEMTAANLIVLPTYREGLPRVILEAALANRAVITTDVPGCREIVEHGKSGLLVPPRDAGALAESIEVLLDDVVRRSDLASRLRERVKQEFSDAVLHPRWWDLYQQADA